MKGLKYFVVLAGAALIASTAGAANIPASGDPLWTTCAMAGTNYGLPVVFDTVAHNCFVQSVGGTPQGGPSSEVIYRAQFWIDPATWNGVEGDYFVFARGTQDDHPPAMNTKQAFQLVLTKKSGLYRVFARTLNGYSTTSERNTGRINLMPGSPSLLQIEWTADDAPGAPTLGTMVLTVLDGYNTGASTNVAAGLNNYYFDIDRFSLGAMGAVSWATQTGHICYDEFASFRTLAP